MTGWNDNIRDFHTAPPPLARWKVRAARVALWIEALTAAFWQPVALALFYAGLGFGNFYAFTGTLAANLAAAAFYIALAVLIRRGLRRFEAPSLPALLRRLERENALPHRPLSSLDDRAAEGGNLDLWALAREKRRAQAANAKPFLPGPVLARRDPLGLRYLAALTFCTGLVVAGARWPERLETALFPFRIAMDGAAREDDSIVLWITPPAYTGFGKLVLKGGGAVAEPIKLPQGSVFKIRVTGGFGTPEARMGDYRFKLSNLGGGSHGAELMAVPGKEFVLRQMLWNRLSVPYDYIVDTPPVVTLTEAPEPLPGGRMRFKLPVHDDYGVRDLEISVTAAEPADAMPAFGGPIHDVRPVMTAGGGKDVDIAPVYDLTAHPWAGLPALVTFTVTDALGQKAQSETLRIVLPERQFLHPVAKELVALRRKLLWTPQESREEVARALEEIMVRPGLYGGDPTVFLMLRVAASRLYYNKKIEQTGSVVPLLWDLALRIEDGNLSLAARELRDAREALEQALRDPKTTQEELAVLNEQLREAMANYLREMGRELQKRMAQGEKIPVMPPDSAGKTLDGRMLEGLLDRLQSESLSGNRDKAMEMLSMLEHMTDLMDGAMNAQMPPDVKFMADGISELQELVNRQQQLLDQTRDQAQRMQDSEGFSYGAQPAPRPQDGGTGGPEMGEMPPAPAPGDSSGPAIDTTANKAEQEALRRVLGELMREAGEKLGEVPDSFGKAELSMRDSSKALGENRPEDSVPHQEEAIRHLKDGAQKLGQQMKQRLEKMTGLSFSQGQTDPFGRPMENPNEGGRNPFPDQTVKIPSEAERRKIDEILKTLRQRSGEYSRPQEEIDYLRRLLKQF